MGSNMNFHITTGHEKVEIAISTLRHQYYVPGATVIVGISTSSQGHNTGDLTLFFDNLDTMEELQEKMYQYITEARAADAKEQGET